jgi:energy-coupling factor transport system ATP-binding protein
MSHASTSQTSGRISCLSSVTAGMADVPSTYPISLERVSYRAVSSVESRPILNDISLTVNRGEWLSIVGANGSGKSTLAKVIAQIYPISSGTLTYRIDEIPSVQSVFQNPSLQIVGEHLYEEVIFGMENFGVDPALIRPRAMEALNQAGISHLADQPISQLSGGQKQLLAIACCLALNPPVLLFDEATSMLDPIARTRILDTARRLHRAGRTVIWITQLLDELAYSDRVVALEGGSLVFDGSKEQFFYGDPSDVDRSEAFTDSLGESVTGHPHPNICEQLGFTAPYTVQVAQLLRRQGCKLEPLPYTPEQLSEAVSAIV